MSTPTIDDIGRKAKDRITGFAGTITGFARYITGCDQYLVTPPVDKEGKIVKGNWYDENRLELTDEPNEKVELDTVATKGPGEPAPIK